MANEETFVITLNIDRQAISAEYKKIYSGLVGALKIKLNYLNWNEEETVIRFAYGDSEPIDVIVNDEYVDVPPAVVNSPGFDVAVGGYHSDGVNLNRFVPSASIFISVSNNGYGAPDNLGTIDYPSLEGQLIAIARTGENLPYVGENGNWYLYDVEAKEYYDSGISSKGAKGDKGDAPVKGKDYWIEEDKTEIVAEASEIVKGIITERYIEDKELLNERCNYQDELIAKKADLEYVETIEKIAKGRASGYVFDTYDEMIAWISIDDNSSQLKLGDNLYIRATDVPDYWWDGEGVQQLETQKVDLSEYATKDTVRVFPGVVELGNGAVVDSDEGVAIGENAITHEKGVSIGGDAFSKNGGSALGSEANADSFSVSLGNYSKALPCSVSVGCSSESAEDGVAIGYGAIVTAKGAIQIGLGTNSIKNTLQVLRYLLLDESGNIPKERLGLVLGDIDTALDSIIAIQNELIGGESE